jgi:hypothetical protein
MCDFERFIPEALRFGIVLRFTARHRRPALVKIFTGHGGHLGRCGQVNQSLRSLLWRESKTLGYADTEPYEATGLVAKARRNKARWSEFAVTPVPASFRASSRE